MSRNLHFLLLLVAFTYIYTVPAVAQMEIDEIPTKVQSIIFCDSIAESNIADNYFSPARYRAERDSIRKERNTLEITASLQGSLVQYNQAWLDASGGDNSMTTLSSINLKHTYTKNLFSLETQFSAKFGYYRVGVERTADDGSTYDETVWYKNQDEFSLSIAPAIKMSKNWSYGGSLKFRSQFADGYVSSASQERIHLKSGFMAPGYLTISLGVNYQSPLEKLPFKVSISPLAVNGTYVSSELIRQNALYQYLEHTDANELYVEPYGVSPYASSKVEGGSSLQIDFDRTFGKKGAIRYVTSVFTFYGWISELSYSNIYTDYDEFTEAITQWNSDNEGIKPVFSIRPTVRWENRVEIKATQLLSTTLSYQMYYDMSQSLKMQTQTLLTVGLAYTFKNK
ncbi:MAG: DUF3078 domain-containing protein [Rikenellaceae bacterium]